MSSNNFSTERSENRPNKIFIVLFVAISFFGFLDATYLTVKFFTGGPIPCSLLDGCDVVTKSAYATLGGIPVALLGALYYIGLFLLSLIILETKNQKLLTFLSLIPAIGFIFSIRLVYLQAFVLDAYCLYCIISAGISTILFALGIILYARQKKATLTYYGTHIRKETSTE